MCNGFIRLGFVWVLQRTSACNTQDRLHHRTHRSRDTDMATEGGTDRQTTPSMRHSLALRHVESVVVVLKLVFVIHAVLLVLLAALAIPVHTQPARCRRRAGLRAVQ